MTTRARAKPDRRELLADALTGQIKHLRLLIANARGDGMTWQEIGTALELPAWQVRCIAGETVRAHRDARAHDANQRR